MKITKGEAGYIRYKKKIELLRVILEFGIVIALFITGYVTTKTRLNLLTLVAVLGCLPASKAMVGFIMLLPRQSMEERKVREIEAKGEHLTKLYDMILTSYEHVMPIDSIVIAGNTVCGYSGNEKLKVDYAEKYIRKTLANNYCEKASVKIFRDYPSYLARVEGMETMASVADVTDKKHEEEIRHTILTLSM